MKEEIIQGLISTRDGDISEKYSIQDQLVMIFNLLSGEKKIEDYKEVVGYIQNVYTLFHKESAKIDALDEKELENYEPKMSFVE